MRDSATGSTEGVGGPDDERDFREPDLVGECVGLFHGVDDGGGGYRFAEGVHELAELVAVLGLADGSQGGAKQADVVLLKNACVGEFAREVESGLSAERGQEAFGALAGDDALEDGNGERLDVDGVGDFGVGHDGGGIGVDEDAAHAFLAHGLAGLRSGVVELGGLADDDRAGPDDEDGCGLVADWDASGPDGVGGVFGHVVILLSEWFRANRRSGRKGIGCLGVLGSPRGGTGR